MSDPPDDAPTGPDAPPGDAVVAPTPGGALPAPNTAVAPPDAEAPTPDDAPPELDPDALPFVPREDRPGLVGALFRHRKVLFVAGLLWFGVVVAGGIFLSQLDARVGLHVFGPDTWVAGEPAVVRATLRDLRFNRFEPLGGVQVFFRTTEGDESPRQVIGGQAGPFVQGEVTPPARPGAYQLVLEASGKRGRTYSVTT